MVNRINPVRINLVQQRAYLFTLFFKIDDSKVKETEMSNFPAELICAPRD